jgi:predicted Zn-dependent peptidase
MRFFVTIIILLGGLMANSLPKYYTKILNNGLEVIAIPLDNKSKVISTDIFYKVGSANEIMGKTGIAHMLEHLNFKSTKNLKSGEFDEIVKGYGGVNNASTSFDYTHYYIKSSNDNLAGSLKLFSELMQNLNLTDEEFQPERNVVAEERRWRTDNNPLGYLYFKLFNTAFVYHPYHWTPIGFMNDIQTWRIEDIRAFHETYYQPSNALIIVSGDIDPEDVFKESERFFSSIKNTQKIVHNYINSNTIAYKSNKYQEKKQKDNSKLLYDGKKSKNKILYNPHFIEPKQDGAKRLMIHKESEVEMVAIAYHIPAFDHEDQATLSAISEILSSGKSSRLYKELVVDNPMVNQVYAYNMENKDPSLFLFLASCNPNVKAEDVEAKLLEQINKLKTELVTQKELDKLKINVKSDFIYSLESASSVGNLLGGYLVRGNLEPLMQYEDKIQNLKAEDLKKIANRYFDEDQSTTIILRKRR